MQKYEPPKFYRVGTSIPVCCKSRVGTVKLHFNNKPKGKQIPKGQEPYECYRGGYHLRKIRN